MNDEEYIKIRREIESMTNDQIRAHFGFADDAAPNLSAEVDARVDSFVPRYVNPLAKESVASLLRDSIQNGDTPMQRQITMSIAVPIFAKAYSERSDSVRKFGEEKEHSSADASKLGEIRDKIRRLIENAE